MLQYYKQGDPRWGKLKLGNSNCTMEKYGCTTTCVAIARGWMYGSAMTPGQVVGKLSYTDREHYPTLSEGLILWGSLENVGLRLVSRINFRDDKSIKNTLTHRTRTCLLEVQNGAHWVFLIGRYIPGLGYNTIDPWTGKKKYYSNVTGCAIIDKL